MGDHVLVSNPLKALHDRLMESAPDDVEHDATNCVFCALEADPDSPKGGPAMGDFTQAQVDELVAAAVAEATKPLTALQAELEQLKAANQETEVGKAVADAIAPLETKIAEMQQQLDAAEAAKTTAEAALTNTVAYLEAEVTANAEKAAAAERKDARVKVVEEIGCFKDEYIAEHAERWSTMDDEAFQAQVDEWKLIASANPAGTGTGEVFTPPPATAFQASRAEGGSTPQGSALRHISTMRRDGQDPRRTA